MFDENVLNKDCVNVRCIKSELTKSGPEREYLAEIQKINDKNLKSYSQEADHSDAIEKLEICDCDIVHDKCKVNYNGIEAADGKANGSENRIGHQYGIDIEKDKVKTFINYQKLSVIKNVSRSCNYRQCDEME
ncbi:37994_t:CDS:2 [Gigaspora margarita]|uniref:37994_t:CDS:1 n=1 Tax=Gigaspora margarita TaxID=4874 RepID=A0ABN7VFZ2_GIGMA|nr:37994_t:CDS:2 [Gigaspora margarita]